RAAGPAGRDEPRRIAAVVEVVDVAAVAEHGDEAAPRAEWLGGPRFAVRELEQRQADDRRAESLEERAARHVLAVALHCSAPVFAKRKASLVTIASSMSRMLLD